MELSGFWRLKPFCATLAAIVVTVAPIFALQPVRAATVDTPSLVVRLNADGSLVVSQRDRTMGAAITLPSIQALPAEIDALVPRMGERKKLAVAADSAGPYGNFVNLMSEAQDAGFGEISILGPEKEPRGGPSELVVNLTQRGSRPPSNRALFISLENDETVILSLGIGAEATGVSVKLSGASDAAAGLVPKARAKKEVYFRADLEAPVGSAFELQRELRAIGFIKVGIVVEATEKNH